jgi:hypothetical protein
MQEPNNHILQPSVFIREFGRESAFWAAVAILLLLISIPRMSDPMHVFCSLLITSFAIDVIAWLLLSIDQNIFKGL